MDFKLNPHKIFQCNGKEYLFVAETGALFELDEVTSFLIRQNGADFESMQCKMNTEFGLSNDALRTMLDDLHEVRLLGYTPDTVALDYSLDFLHGIELMVCQCCNLACTYCYASEGEYHNPGWMSEDVGRQAIDFLFAQTKDDSVSISFFGGEPLMNMSLIRNLVQYANQLALQHNKRVAYSVTTNGTLIDDDVAVFLRENNFYVSLSIDGTQAGHDLCRVDKTGQGSYADSIKNVALLNRNHVSLRATATPENCNYAEIADALYGLKETDFFIGEAMNCFTTEESLQLIELSYESLIEQFANDLSCGKIKKCKANSLIYQCLKKIAYFKERSCSCPAFISTIAVDVNGELYPCHRFVGSSYRIGNVNTNGIDVGVAKQLFAQDFLKKNRHGCSQCWAQNLCVGGCPYLNKEATGQCDTPDKHKCRLNKYLYEKLIVVFLMLTNEQKCLLGLM